MTLSYSRIEIRTRVNNILRDPGNGKIPEATKNRVIADVHREFVTLSQCNRNVIVFRVELVDDGQGNKIPKATLEYDMNGSQPEILILDVAGQQYIRIRGCELVRKIKRWAGAVNEHDGQMAELRAADEGTVDREYLERVTADVAQYVQFLDSPDTFRLLPPVAPNGYPFRLGVSYIEAVQDLLSDDRMPTDKSRPIYHGTGLNDLFIQSPANTYGKWEFQVVEGGDTNPNTFRWRKVTGGDEEWSSELSMSATPITISNGLSIYWEDVIGHTSGDTWIIYQDDYRVPTVPLKYRQFLIAGVVAQLLLHLDDTRAPLYAGIYQQGIMVVKNEIIKTNTVKPPLLRQTYAGSGW